jgi:glycosyltransferase involved in cell wall biosynthesis
MSNAAMKVAISIPGRGASTLYLACELYKMDMLDRFITSYPKFEIAKYGLPKEKIVSLLAKELIQRAWSRMPDSLRNRTNPDFLLSEIFDRSAAQRIRPADIFWGWSSNSLHALRAARRSGALTVVEVGNAPMIEQNELLREEYQRVGWRYASHCLSSNALVRKSEEEYAEADYFAVPSNYIRGRLLARGIASERIIRIPYGVSTSSFRKIPKRDDVFRVIFAGGMTLRKGVHYLLQAFAELNLPNSELLLIGSLNEEMRPLFSRYSGSFRWIGHLPQSELYKWYSQGSVFAFPSLDDGFGGVIVQAMSCGLPVIASTNTGGPDVVTEGREGFIVAVRDVAALKDRIRYCYEHPDDLRRMGAAAERRVATGLTWEHYGNAVIDALRGVLARRK